MADNTAQSESENLLKSQPGFKPDQKEDFEKRIDAITKAFVQDLVTLKQEILTEKSKPINVNFPETQNVSGGVNVKNFPDLTKVQGKVSIDNLPEVQKVEGKVDVVFPKTQEISGTVEAILKGFKFPEVQKIEGNVSVAFPELQKVYGEIKVIGLPIGRGRRPDTSNPAEYLPVRLTNGAEFYDAMSQTAMRGTGSGGSSSQEMVSLLQSLITAESSTPYFDADGDNTAQSIRTTAGKLSHLEVHNPNTVDCYIQLFDLPTTSVTVGTTTPIQSFLVPAGDGTKDGAMDKLFASAINFSKAITYACTTTATGSTDPTTGLIVNAGHRN